MSATWDDQLRRMQREFEIMNREHEQWMEGRDARWEEDRRTIRRGDREMAMLSRNARQAEFTMKLMGLSLALYVLEGMMSYFGSPLHGAMEWISALGMAVVLGFTLRNRLTMKYYYWKYKKSRYLNNTAIILYVYVLLAGIWDAAGF